MLLESRFCSIFRISVFEVFDLQHEWFFSGGILDSVDGNTRQPSEASIHFSDFTQGQKITTNTKHQIVSFHRFHL